MALYFVGPRACESLEKSAFPGVTGRGPLHRMDNSIRKVPALEELDFTLQSYAGFLTVEWSIFDGFAGANAERVARAAHGAAEANLADARKKAVAEVWRDYVEARNAIARRESAEVMVAAANARFASALQGFQQGLVDMPGLVLARAARVGAERARADSNAAVLASFAHLALGAGEMDEGFLAPRRR